MNRENPYNSSGSYQTPPEAYGNRIKPRNKQSQLQSMPSQVQKIIKEQKMEKVIRYINAKRITTFVRIFLFNASIYVISNGILEERKKRMKDFINRKNRKFGEFIGRIYEEMVYIIVLLIVYWFIFIFIIQMTMLFAFWLIFYNSKNKCDNKSGSSNDSEKLDIILENKGFINYTANSVKEDFVAFIYIFIMTMIATLIYVALMWAKMGANTKVRTADALNDIDIFFTTMQYLIPTFSFIANIRKYLLRIIIYIINIITTKND